jgi:hypothetical protein
MESGTYWNALASSASQSAIRQPIHPASLLHAWLLPRLRARVLCVLVESNEKPATSKNGRPKFAVLRRFGDSDTVYANISTGMSPNQVSLSNQ